ncbi:MAG TPA: hypothetical protein PLB31_05260 [Fimbriimonadaceae bacterium]|nr:hypothetical protein [Armatimonadota bacterium]HCM73597.1 hypothetical protein [Armatimonadota bacterium]HRD32584.1 hypothetical protein [Fimbriimonadaceae bacterium]HRI73863.1 hypothetical protein [Fimbriimonadaceae bacterium]
MNITATGTAVFCLAIVQVAAVLVFIEAIRNIKARELRPLAVFMLITSIGLTGLAFYHLGGLPA